MENHSEMLVLNSKNGKIYFKVAKFFASGGIPLQYNLIIIARNVRTISDGTQERWTVVQNSKMNIFFMISAPYDYLCMAIEPLVGVFTFKTRISFDEHMPLPSNHCLIFSPETPPKV